MVNTLPLYQTPTILDAWHNVTSPGGYEWWYFDAEDTANDRQIVAMLFDGCPFHPGYLRHYARYARNPTGVSPPRSSEFICAYFAVYRAGRVEQQFWMQCPADVFEARREKRHVVIGANQFTAGNALESLELTMGGTTWQRAVRSRRLREQLRTEVPLWASLKFSPRFKHTPDAQDLFSRQFAGAGADTGAAHRWIIANPLCDVQGDILIPGSGPIQFRGRGYHDHTFGTRPIGLDIKQWFRGRLLLAERCVTFQLACPRDARRETEIHLIEIDASGSRALDIDQANMSIDWSRRTSTWLRYPNAARFGDVLALANPRVIDSSLFALRVIYDATLRGSASGHALCEIVCPGRLRVPILGRTIERSIDQRAMDSV